MSIDTTFLRRCIATLKLLPGFIADATALADTIDSAPDD